MHMQGALQTLQNASFRIKHYDFKLILIPKIYLGTYHKLGAKLCLKLFFHFQQMICKRRKYWLSYWAVSFYIKKLN